MHSAKQLSDFITTIWHYYHEHKRHFLWRIHHEPYYVVVSEVMLQQTQTHRVMHKFEEFLARFNTFESLAQAPLKDILTTWQGLGYNRRALYLQQIAQKVISEYNGSLPTTPDILVTFPGIGKATAASICAFAYNQPTAFIETNIRTVFIYFFFNNKVEVTDNDIYPLVQQTVDTHNPREWYYALMDYGVMLKKNIPNPNRKSAHYTKQSKFEGSDRQIRGMILKTMAIEAALSFNQLCAHIEREPERIKKALLELIQEGFIVKKSDLYSINS